MTLGLQAHLLWSFHSWNTDWSVTWDMIKFMFIHIYFVQWLVVNSVIHHTFYFICFFCWIRLVAAISVHSKFLFITVNVSPVTDIFGGNFCIFQSGLMAFTVTKKKKYVVCLPNILPFNLSVFSASFSWSMSVWLWKMCLEADAFCSVLVFERYNTSWLSLSHTVMRLYAPRVDPTAHKC